MRRILVLVVGLLTIPGVAWAGGGGHASACAGYSEGATVSMRDSCFSGVAHFAPSGTKITVRNDGSLPHTLTAVDGSFDTGQLAGGQSTDLSITEPGVYRVFCSLHGTAAGEGMAGVLVVGDATTAAVMSPIGTTTIEEVNASSPPAQIPVVDTERTLILVLVGLAAGLALASLLTALRLGITADHRQKLERLEPGIGT